MRTGVLLAFLPLILATACRSDGESFGQEQAEALEVEVRETLAGLTEAMNQHDPDRVLGYYKESERFLYLGCTYFMLGWETFSPRAWSYHVANPQVVFHQEVVEVQVVGPTVAVAALQGGSSEAEALFWTEVLVKEDGAWKITYEHESWPGCPPPPTPHPFTTGEDMPGMEPSGSLPDTAGS